MAKKFKQYFYSNQKIDSTSQSLFIPQRYLFTTSIFKTRDLGQSWVILTSSFTYFREKKRTSDNVEIYSIV
jgi:hypothetical protein